MNARMLLLRLDTERQTIADVDVTLEKTPHVVRAIAKHGSWNGIVYSHFLSEEAESVISCEIGFFNKLQRSFEWKIYSHDEPPDLLEHLRRRGFKIGEEEALMILDLEHVPLPLLAPASEGVTVKPITNERGIAHFLALERAIWDQLRTTREFLLSMLSDPHQRDLAFVAYFAKKPIGIGRVAAPPQSHFAGLWGGSVLQEFRGLGVYRALLSARIQHASRLDSIRYLRVDALPESRPILEKYGFRKVASTWPADWPFR
jgi:GNAT superfamily N-acetyltransferase